MFAGGKWEQGEGRWLITGIAGIAPGPRAGHLYTALLPS